MFWQSGCRDTHVSSALVQAATAQTAAHQPSVRQSTVHPRMRQRLRLTALILTPILMMLALQMPLQAQAAIHVIEPGDNLTRVAQQYNIDPAELALYNDITDPNHILLGQSLMIPPRNEFEPTAPNSYADTPPSAAVISPIQAPRVDANSYHAVQAGESLTAIAQYYGLATDDLLRLNGLTDANHILVGQVLRLTAKVSQLPGHTTAEPALATTIYVVQEGDTLSEIAYDYRITMDQLLRDNGLPHEESIYVGQRLRIEEPSYVATGLDTSQAPTYGARRIVIDLSDQTLTAYQGDTVVMHTYVSTGKASTPTVIGDFNIYVKYASQRMTGPDYDLEGVPWVMYYDGDFGIHGAYWHNAFGVPTSHGCTNMHPDEAKALYEWASVGTPVHVQW